MDKLFSRHGDSETSLSKGAKFVLIFPFIYCLILIFVLVVTLFVLGKWNDLNSSWMISLFRGFYIFCIFLSSILLLPFTIFYNYLSATHLLIIFIVGLIVIFIEGLIILGIYRLLNKIFKRKAIYILIILILVFMTLPVLLPRLGNYRMEKEGNKIVAKVEEFRKINGRLPSSRAEMGLPDSESIKPQYIKVNNTDYEIFYPIGFDDGYVYYSKTQKWENYPTSVDR